MFLHGDLHETIFMEQPLDFLSNFTQMCQLNKVIYGLKQAPRDQYKKISTTLACLGFTPTISDPYLFIKTTVNSVIYILIYVDDILITVKSKFDINRLNSTLNKTFTHKDLGRLHYFLGIEVNWTTIGSFHLIQTH